MLELAFINSNFSHNEVENIYSNLARFNISILKKFDNLSSDDNCLVNKNIEAEKIIILDKCKTNKIIKKNEDSIEINQTLSNKIAYSDSVNFENSKKVLAIKDFNFKTKDGIFFTSFKNKNYNDPQTSNRKESKTLTIIKKESKMISFNKESNFKIEYHLIKESISDDDSISIPDIN